MSPTSIAGRTRDAGTRARADASVKQPLERWFVHHGVPHFMHRYSAVEQIPLLLLLLSVILAFELGAAPWLDLSATKLVIAPPVLIVLTLCALPALAGLFAVNICPSHWSILLRLCVLWLATLVFVPNESLVPSDAWVNFAVLFLVFATAALLFSRKLWAYSDTELCRRRRRLVIVLCAALIGFALEGSVIGSFDNDAGGPPQGLPALAVVALLLVLATRLARSSHGAQLEEPLENRRVAVYFPAVPLLLVVLGGETAVLPHAAAAGWQQAILPLGCALALVAVAAVGFLRADPGPFDPERKPDGRGRLLAVMVPVFVLAYPLIVWKFLEVDAFGTSVTGLDAFLVTAGINVLYLGLAWLVVTLGLDRIAAWTVKDARRNARRLGEGVARGLPLLLVVTAFLVLQAELWEVAAEVGTLEYAALVGLLLLVPVGFAFVSTLQQLDRNKTFDDWAAVYDGACAGADTRSDLPEDVEQALKRLKDDPDQSKPPEVELSWFKKLNAVTLVGAYQALVILPVTIVAAVLFYLLGQLAVPPAVAGEWVYGDESPATKGEELAARPFLEQPWSKVTVLLAAFSALYLTVQVLSDPDLRKDFFEWTDQSIRRRFALRVAYLHLVAPQDATHRRPRARLDAWRSARRRDSVPPMIHAPATDLNR